MSEILFRIEKGFGVRVHPPQGGETRALALEPYGESNREVNIVSPRGGVALVTYGYGSNAVRVGLPTHADPDCAALVELEDQTVFVRPGESFTLPKRRGGDVTIFVI